MTRELDQSPNVREQTAERRALQAAGIAALLLVVVTVAVFVSSSPFGAPYEFEGVFASANGLHDGSEVRIAGVRIGKVSKIEPGPDNTSVVTMQTDSADRPIQEDARLAIKPRLLLEGNFYVDVEPGTPGSQALPPGARIPKRRTSIPVQLDQVLSTFDLPTRNALHRSIAALSEGLGSSEESHGGDSKQDELTAAGSKAGRPDPEAGAPSPPGFKGLRSAIREFDSTLPSVSTVSRAAQGQRPGDLSAALRGSSDFAGQLAADPAALAGLVSDVNAISGALADEDQALRDSLRGLDDVLHVAPASLDAIDAALPDLQRFSSALEPGLRVAPPAIKRATRLVTELRRLVVPTRLPRTVSGLKPITGRLPELETRLERLAPLVTSANQCLSRRVVPALNQVMDDGDTSSGDPVWLDALHAFTAVTSASGGFDGNGSALRAGIVGGGGVANGILPGIGKVSVLGPLIQGVRPTWLGYGVDPPYRPDKRCSEQPFPSFEAKTGPAPAWAKWPRTNPGTLGKRVWKR